MHCFSYVQLVNSVRDFVLITPPSPITTINNHIVWLLSAIPEIASTREAIHTGFFLYCNRYLRIDLAKAKTEASIYILLISLWTYAKKSRSLYLTDFKTKRKT